MMTRGRWVGGLALLMASGCGSSVAIDGSDESVPPTSVPVDVEALGEPLCSARPAGAPLMVALGLESSSILRNDGKRLPLELGAGALDEEASHVSGIARGAYLATFASSWTHAGTVEASTVVSMFDGGGVLRWRLHAPDHDVSGIAIDDSGRLLVGRYVYATGTGDEAVVEDGILTALPPQVTQARSWARDGVLRATVNGEPGFYDLTTGEATPIAQAEAALQTRPWADGYVSLFEGKSVPWLALSHVEGSELVVLWDVDEPASQLELRDLEGDFALLHSAVTERLWRLSLLDGQAVELTTVTPNGAPPEEMLYCTPAPMLAEDGRVVMVGGDGALRFHAFDPTSAAWSSLGEPLREVEMVYAAEQAGTFLLEGVVNTYCPGFVGTGEEGLAGASSQIVRPALGVSRAVEGSWTSIHESGTCATYVQEGRQHLWDLATGDEQDLGDTGGWWWQAP